MPRVQGLTKPTRIKSTKQERAKIARGLTSARNSPWVGMALRSDQSGQAKCTCSWLAGIDLKFSKGDIPWFTVTPIELAKKRRNRNIKSKIKYLTKQMNDAQFQKDKLLLKIEYARDGKPWDDIGCDSNKGVDVLKSYKSRIQALKGDFLLPKILNTSKWSETDYLDSDDNALHPKKCLSQNRILKPLKLSVSYHFEDEEKELKNIDLCKRNLITNLKNRTKDLSKSM
ncbi:hypothetical protein Tco_0364946 [Tanacetum coccineum]